MSESIAVIESVRRGIAYVVVLAIAAGVFAAPADAQCVGDCGGDGTVSIADLILGVNIVLGNQPAGACPAFQNAQGNVDIAQLIKGVNNALSGCAPGPTATSTNLSPPTATDTVSPAATATGTTVPNTATPVDTQTGTPVAPTNTASPNATATATAADTATPVPTATATMVATPTATEFPVGDAVAGHAAIAATGLSGVQAIVSAVVAQVANPGPSLTEVTEINAVSPQSVDQCPISGTTAQSCTPMGSDAAKTVHVVLAADDCVAAGPAGGSAEFNGTITVDSTPNLLNGCNPIRFFGGTYATDGLDVVFRNDASAKLLEATANVNGTLAIGIAANSCFVGSVTLHLTGSLVSLLSDGTGVSVDFANTQMVMDQITFNDDCVPTFYRLTFDGPATIELLGPATAVTNGGVVQQSFNVTFMTFRITQDARTNPVSVQLSGSMTSDCFGPAPVGLQTLVPVAVAAGELCPSAGTLDVTASDGTAMVTYGQGGSVVVMQSGAQQSFDSCLAPALLTCPSSP
jgi:hypothetical protein